MVATLVRYGCHWKHEEVNESRSPKGGNLGWIEGRGGSWGGEWTPPPCLHCTGEPGRRRGALPDSLSVTIGVRHLAGTRKSGITQETEIVAQLPVAQVLHLVGRP